MRGLELDSEALRCTFCQLASLRIRVGSFDSLVLWHFLLKSIRSVNMAYYHHQPPTQVFRPTVRGSSYLPSQQVRAARKYNPSHSPSVGEVSQIPAYWQRPHRKTAPPPSPTPFRWHAHLYFPDGNIIVVIERTVFRLHPFKLMESSYNFAGLFRSEEAEALARGPRYHSTRQTSQGCPVYPISQVSATAFATLMQEVYTPSYVA